MAFQCGTRALQIFTGWNYLEKNSEPFNDWEPVDSSAAVIAAQGLIRWVITSALVAKR